MIFLPFGPPYPSAGPAATSGTAAAAAVVLVLLTGCASGGRADSGAPPPLEELRAESEGRSTVGMEDVRIWRNDVSVGMEVPAPEDEVMRAAPAAYRALEIPLAVHDLEGGVVGNPEWQPRRIAGERIPRYFRCGSGNSATSHRGSYAYRISVETRIRDGEEDRTVVETRASATARSRNTTGNRLRCVSRQRLERAINGAILGALELSAPQDP